MSTFPPVPSLPQGVSVQPTTSNLDAMNQSAANHALPVSGSTVLCEKKSWFSIRVVDEKEAVVEGLTLKLKITGLGDAERVTSKAIDPVRISDLDPGGKGDVLSIQTEEVAWEAVGDIT